MVSFEEFKEALGDVAPKYTDKEIVRIKEIEEGLVDIIIDQLLYEDEQKAAEENKQNNDLAIKN